MIINHIKKAFRKFYNLCYYGILVILNWPDRPWKKTYVRELYSHGINKNEWKNTKKGFQKYYSERPFLHKTKLSYYLLLFDFRLCYLFLGADHTHYFNHQLYKHGWKYRNNSLFILRIHIITDIVDKKEPRHYIGVKSETAELYRDYYGRKWVSFPECTADQFRETFANVKRIIVKPENKWGGVGIEVYEVNNNAEELYQKISGMGKVVVEEYYEQKGFLHDINPSSLNTLRVLTFRVSKDKVYILNALLRAGGKDAVVDNLCAGGYCYGIDSITGKFQRGYRSDFEREVKCHPSTMVQVEGMSVPRWNEVISFCKKIQLMAPEGLDFLGWDICVSDDEIIIVEGNYYAGSNAPINKRDNQWGKLKKIMNEWERQ